MCNDVIVVPVILFDIIHEGIGITERAFGHLAVGGDNGFLTDFARPEQAAQTLVRALQTDLDTLAILGQRAQQTAARYAWENVVDRFISIYNEVVS